MKTKILSGVILSLSFNVNAGVAFVAGDAEGVNLASEISQIQITQTYGQELSKTGYDVLWNTKKNTKAIAKQASVTRQIITKLFKGLNDGIFKDFTELGLAQQKAEARRTFGEQSRTTSVCDAKELANGLKKGKIVEKQIASESAQSFETWNNSYQSEPKLLDNIQTIDQKAFSNETIHPLNQTLTESQIEQVKKINQLILNPFPPQPINKSLSTTEEGVKYNASSNLMRVSQLASESVKSQVLAEMAPTITGMEEWAKEIWAFMGQKGTPPELIEHKLSFNGILNLMIQSKFGNPCWQSKVNGQACIKKGKIIEQAGNQVWVDRQLLVSDTLLLEIKKRQLFYEKKIAEILSEKRASQIYQSKVVLDNLHRKTISSN